eukprot:355487-Chlamydomonas_euryale.AAC.2
MLNLLEVAQHPHMLSRCKKRYSNSGEAFFGSIWPPLSMWRGAPFAGWSTQVPKGELALQQGLLRRGPHAERAFLLLPLFNGVCLAHGLLHPGCSWQRVARRKTSGAEIDEWMDRMLQVTNTLSWLAWLQGG